MAIFDRAIPPDRIAAHYKAGKEGGEAPGAEPPIQGISISGSTLSVRYDGTLQSAPTVIGPWTAVAGAPSGEGQTHTTEPSASERYFRASTL